MLIFIGLVENVTRATSSKAKMNLQILRFVASGLFL